MKGIKLILNRIKLGGFTLFALLSGLLIAALLTPAAHASALRVNDRLSVRFDNHPDSDFSGGNWAADYFTQDMTVFGATENANGTWNYFVTYTADGSFRVTSPVYHGATENVTVPVGLWGTLRGTGTVEVTDAPAVLSAQTLRHDFPGYPELGSYTETQVLGNDGGTISQWQYDYTYKLPRDNHFKGATFVQSNTVNTP